MKKIRFIYISRDVVSQVKWLPDKKLSPWGMQSINNTIPVFLLRIYPLELPTLMKVHCYVKKSHKNKNGFCAKYIKSTNLVSAVFAFPYCQYLILKSHFDIINIVHLRAPFNVLNITLIVMRSHSSESSPKASRYRIHRPAFIHNYNGSCLQRISLKRAYFLETKSLTTMLRSLHTERK